MASCPLPAVLAVLAGFLCWTALGRSKHMGPYADPICTSTPGLTKRQIYLCYREHDTVRVALEGMAKVLQECQHQFQNQRWNCSGISLKNPYSSPIYKRGFRQSAFAYSLSSAGVAISVARACSQGLLKNCSCGKPFYRGSPKSWRTTSKSWKWKGCSDNLQYGLSFSKKFLDARESPADFHSVIILHNNKVGRKAVRSNLQKKCKCHGVSASCTMKVCWTVMPPLRLIGDALMKKYHAGVAVDLDNDRLHQHKKRRRVWTPRQPQHNNLSNQLIFYEKSPSFCEAEPSLSLAGTTGRRCALEGNQTDFGTCSDLCCGRGHNQIRQRRVESQCKFLWCCRVECHNSTVDEYISVCK